MPKGSEELTLARREEIVNACAALYETMGFKEITIRDIGEKTSFTRTSIYNYFQTKEEIFLDILSKEYCRWMEDMDRQMEEDALRSRETYCRIVTDTVQRRPQRDAVPPGNAPRLCVPIAQHRYNPITQRLKGRVDYQRPIQKQQRRTCRAGGGDPPFPSARDHRHGR